MLIPLEQFNCDKCGRLIRSKDEGLIEYRSTIDLNEDRGFKIVHRLHYSSEPEPGCYHYGYTPDEEALTMTMPLAQLGELDDPDSHLAWIDAGRYQHRPPGHSVIADLKEWDEILRRLTLPYYEEARGYLSAAIDDSMIYPLDMRQLYSPSTLIEIIATYSPVTSRRINQGNK